MTHHTLPTLLALVLVTGCSGGQLMPADNSRFSVTSTPSDAEVYTMGRLLGHTPLEVETKQVFPLNFTQGQRAEYGRLVIEHPGCQPFVTPVSNTIIADGLHAALDCTQPPATDTKSTPEPKARARLIQLKALFEEGLITEQEYRSKRESILDEL